VNYLFSTLHMYIFMFKIGNLCLFLTIIVSSNNYLVIFGSGQNDVFIKLIPPGVLWVSRDVLHYTTRDAFRETYAIYLKIERISPGAYILQTPFLRSLFLEGLIFGGAYLRREICVSKSIELAL